MNNPYAQPPRQSPMLSARSPEECLRQMLRQHNHDPPSVATVRPILDRILVQPSIIKWTEDLVKDLSIFTLVVLASLLASHPGGQPVSEGSLVTFALLTTAMEEWDDNLVYSALLQEYEGPKETKTLLEVMADLVVGDHIAVHRIALVGLSTAYRSMDRLHRYLTLDPYQPDRSWWLESLNQETLSKLTSICAEVLLR